MSAALDNAQAVATQLERVHPALYPLFERSSTTLDLLKQRVEQISSRAMRIVLELAPPGNARQVSLDGGDLGRGGGTQYQYMTVSPIDFTVALEATKKAEISTNSDKKAIADVVRKDMKNGAKEMAWFLDALMQTPGTGQVSTMSAGAGTTTWTLGGNFKTLLLHRGMRVECYDSTFATKRVGVSTIAAVNYQAGTVTVDVAPAAHANTDLVVIEGLTGANPVSLYGIPYYNNTATSGTTLGLTRSTYPEIQTPGVDAGAVLLTPAFLRAALNKLRIKRDDDSILEGLTAHLSPVQLDAYEATAQLVMEISKGPTSKQDYSPFFAPKDILGAPIKTNIKADPTRIDFICKSRWGRALSQDVDFYRDPGDGKTVFPLYGASGGRAAASAWYIIASFQVYSDDPGAGAVVSNLAKPSLYP